MARKGTAQLQIGRTTWDLTPLFKSDSDPLMEKKRKRVEKQSYQFINAWKDRTDYLEDPVVLRKALDQYEAWKGRCGTDGDEGYYFWLRTQQDQNDPKLKAQFNKVEAFSKKIENDSQFFYLRIARIKPGAAAEVPAARSGSENTATSWNGSLRNRGSI